MCPSISAPNLATFDGRRAGSPATRSSAGVSRRRCQLDVPSSARGAAAAAARIVRGRRTTIRRRCGVGDYSEVEPAPKLVSWADVTNGAVTEPHGCLLDTTSPVPSKNAHRRLEFALDDPRAGPEDARDRRGVSRLPARPRARQRRRRLRVGQERQRPARRRHFASERTSRARRSFRDRAPRRSWLWPVLQEGACRRAASIDVRRYERRAARADARAGRVGTRALRRRGLRPRALRRVDGRGRPVHVGQAARRQDVDAERRLGRPPRRPRRRARSDASRRGLG